MTPLPTVVVGYGYAGERIHVPLVRLESRLRLAGICSTSAEKRQRIAQADLGRPYASFDEVLADRSIRLVVLATPNTLHSPQAIAAMEAGKDVLVDKPMCLTSQEAQSMLAAARRTGQILCVFHNRRFDGDFLTIQKLLAEDQLGRLRWSEFSWQKPGLPRTWRRSAGAGGGRLFDLGSHLIDQALLLNSSGVQSVYCRLHRDFPAVDIESHAMVTLSFRDGATAIIDTTSATYSPKPRYRLLGEKATLIKHGIDPQEAALAAGNIDAATESPDLYARLLGPDLDRAVPTQKGQWREFYCRLAEAIDTRKPSSLPVNAEEAASVVAVIEAAHRSAATGEAVTLGVPFTAGA